MLAYLSRCVSACEESSALPKSLQLDLGVHRLDFCPATVRSQLGGSMPQITASEPYCAE